MVGDDEVANATDGNPERQPRRRKIRQTEDSSPR